MHRTRLLIFTPSLLSTAYFSSVYNIEYTSFLLASLNGSGSFFMYVLLVKNISSLFPFKVFVGEKNIFFKSLS